MPGSCHALPHLGTERRLFMEVAVHELAVFPSGDLAAAGMGGKGTHQGSEHSCPLTRCPMPCHSRHGWQKRDAPYRDPSCEASSLSS